MAKRRRAGRLLALALVIGGSAVALTRGAADLPYDPDLPHHSPRGFRNNHPHDIHGLGGFLRWVWQRRHVEVERVHFPLAKPAVGTARPESSVSRLTWIGHSTFLLQAGGVSVLTDPHLTERAFPVSWAGPRRTTPPGIPLDELPPIDFVVISHNHYDHLDSRTIRRLCERQADDQPTFFVPLRLAPTLERFGATRVVELDWWQEAPFGDWRVRAVPVQHFSARTGLDRFRTLWAGWVLEHAGRRFFFAGDTGYSPDFLEIRRRVGPIDLSLLPIGAYEPRWFMRPVHLDPDEAVHAHLDLESRYSVGMHWGTFVLTDEPMTEPLERLAAARETAGVPAERFFLMQHGATRDLAFLADGG